MSRVISTWHITWYSFVHVEHLLDQSSPLIILLGWLFYSKSFFAGFLKLHALIQLLINLILIWLGYIWQISFYQTIGVIYIVLASNKFINYLSPLVYYNSLKFEIKLKYYKDTKLRNPSFSNNIYLLCFLLIYQSKIILKKDRRRIIIMISVKNWQFLIIYN